MKVGKRLGVGLILAVLTFSAIGCGNNGNKETNTTPSAGEASSKPENSPSKTEKVKITYSMWGSEEEGKPSRRRQISLMLPKTKS